MRPFDFYAPTTVVEALTLLDQYKDSVACIAGGTDLTLELNEWKAQPAVVIDLKKLKELDYIKVEDGVVRIGALTSHAEIAANDIIRENVHILYDACRQVGSPQIRNLGTIGGNICQSSVPHSTPTLPSRASAASARSTSTNSFPLPTGNATSCSRTSL